MRLSGSTKLHYEATAADTLTAADGTTIQVQAGDRIAVTSVSPTPTLPPLLPQHPHPAANQPHPTQSAGADTVDPSHPRESYLHIGALPNAAFFGPGGRDVAEAALTEMFRALFKRPNLSRALGPQGELKRVVGVSGVDGAVEYLREDWGAKGEWPVTMKVRWDE